MARAEDAEDAEDVEDESERESCTKVVVQLENDMLKRDATSDVKKSVEDCKDEDEVEEDEGGK